MERYVQYSTFPSKVKDVNEICFVNMRQRSARITWAHIPKRASDRGLGANA